MSAPQFTPGPWRFEMNANETEGNIYGPDDEHVQSYDLGGTFQYNGRKAWETEIANARLIAAAPDLLATLKSAVKAADFHREEGDEYPLWLEDALAAIAKAEGRT